MVTHTYSGGWTRRPAATFESLGGEQLPEGEVRSWGGKRRTFEPVEYRGQTHDVSTSGTFPDEIVSYMDGGVHPGTTPFRRNRVWPVGRFRNPVFPWTEEQLEQIGPEGFEVLPSYRTTHPIHTNQEILCHGIGQGFQNWQDWKPSPLNTPKDAFLLPNGSQVKWGAHMALVPADPMGGTGRYWGFMDPNYQGSKLPENAEIEPWAESLDGEIFPKEADRFLMRDENVENVMEFRVPDNDWTNGIREIDTPESIAGFIGNIKPETETTNQFWESLSAGGSKILAFNVQPYDLNRWANAIYQVKDSPYLHNIEGYPKDIFPEELLKRLPGYDDYRRDSGYYQPLPGA